MLGREANLLLLGLCAVSALICIGAHYSSRRVIVYISKPLTVLCVLVLAAQSGDTEARLYRDLIFAGLLFSLVGDVLLMLPSDRFAAGLASFLVAHLLYVAAFASDGALAGPLPVLLPYAAAGALAWSWLRPGLGRLALPVAGYVAAIVAMAGLATARWLGAPDLASGLAFAGAALFLVSDAVLAADRFRTPFALAQALVLGTYFTGQCLIALSSGVGEALRGGA